MSIILSSMFAGGLLLLAFLVGINSSKVNVEANRWLGMFFGCAFLIVLGSLLNAQGLYQRFPHLIEIDDLAGFFAPPAFYLAILAFTNPSDKSWKQVGYFSLFVIALMLLMPVLIQSGEAKKALIDLPKHEVIGSKWLLNLLTALFHLQFLLFWILSIIRVRKHQRDLNLIVSNKESIDLKWLEHFLYGLLPIIVLAALQLYFPKDWVLATGRIVELTGVIWIGHFAVRQQEIYAFSEESKREIGELISHQSEQQLLSQEDIKTYQSKLEELMIEHKLFKDPSLSLPALAKQLSVSTHQTSFLLNKGFGKSFFEYINKYRVEEAKRLLKNEENNRFSLVGIGYEAGFNSKSAFNATFKKAVGQTPGEYKRLGRDDT
ncbi:MAG: helix-turn-helix transcriptional regulator [Cyclobacteriaceae bacterium]